MAWKRVTCLWKIVNSCPNIFSKINTLYHGFSLSTCLFYASGINFLSYGCPFSLGEYTKRWLAADQSSFQIYLKCNNANALCMQSPPAPLKGIWAFLEQLDWISICLIDLTCPVSLGLNNIQEEHRALELRRESRMEGRWILLPVEAYRQSFTMK